MGQKVKQSLASNRNAFVTTGSHAVSLTSTYYAFVAIIAQENWLHTEV